MASYFNSIIISIQNQVLLSNKKGEFSADTVWVFTGMLCRFIINYDRLLLKEHVPRTQGN